MRAIPEQKYLLVLLGKLIILAWIALWFRGQSPYARFLKHDELRREDFQDTFLVLLIVIGWTLMIIAMMLPTTLPLLTLFYRLTQRRSDRLSLLLLLISGYLLIWMLFGVVAHLGDQVLHKVVEQSAWLETHAWIVGAGILIMAGAYQFTPLKYQCLDKCRSPLSFITEYWRGRDEQWHAFRLGVYHGLFCVGCCWSLMLLMFAVGAGNLGWMFLLGVVMAIEKNMPWGRLISMPVGIILLGWGLTISLQELLAL